MFTDRQAVGGGVKAEGLSWVSFVPIGKCLSNLSAPDTPPQFLHSKKLSDYEVELSWDPPLEANSDILYYVLRVW